MQQGSAKAPRQAFCTILATNYLPKAAALAGSLQRHHPGSTLTALLIDASSDDDLRNLPDFPGLTCVGTDFLGLEEREVLRLATIYNLVEFATAVKPTFLKRLLEEADQAIYLDPDTYVTSPMDELAGDLSATPGGLLLTPHFLEPLGEGTQLSEGHLLNVGVFNLGFCAVDRRAGAFLDWWWKHLEDECLWDPLHGLFVDQKWVDIGSSFFAGSGWRHPGYNVSVANLHERPIGRDDQGLVMTRTGDRLRLFHFHAFDTSAPEELSTRYEGSTASVRAENQALDELCAEYAEILMKHEATVPDPGPYRYAVDTTGRRISRHLRRVYRIQAGVDASALPSPYLRQDATAWEAWRRAARKVAARELLGDAAKVVRILLPEEYAMTKERFPKLSSSIRSKYVRASGIWGG